MEKKDLHIFSISGSSKNTRKNSPFPVRASPGFVVNRTVQRTFLLYIIKGSGALSKYFDVTKESISPAAITFSCRKGLSH